MSLYTTTLEIVVNNTCDDRYAPLDERIESARPRLFNFDYPFINNQPYTKEFKKYFETAFINKYLFDELGSETVARFFQRVHSKLLEVAPRYYTIFSILSRVDFDKLTDLANSYTTHKTGNRGHENNRNNKRESETGSKGTNSILPENMLSAGTIGNFNNVGYANNASITRANTEDTTTENIKGNENLVEDFEYKGHNISMSQFDVLRNINPEFNNYFENLLNEFKSLFMSILY